MGTSFVMETRRARKEHYCYICAGPIYRGQEYIREVILDRRGSKRNKTKFNVSTTHSDAPFCDDEFERVEREHMEAPVAQVMVLRAENRVVLKVGLNGETIPETQAFFVPTVVNETELQVGPSSDNDEEDIPF